MKEKIVVRTGQEAPKSGQYRPAGERRDEVTFIKGHRVPPYHGDAKKFTLVDKTK